MLASSFKITSTTTIFFFTNESFIARMRSENAADGSVLATETKILSSMKSFTGPKCFVT